MKPRTHISINTIRRLAPADLIFLIQWADRQLALGQFGGFPLWLGQWAAGEIERRSTPGCESQLLELEQHWSGTQLSDALLAMHVLPRVTLTATLASFIDELALQVVAHAAAVLQSVQLAEVSDE